MESIHQGEVTKRIKEGIATITFSHPSHNSLPSNLLTQLAISIAEAGKDERVKVIVLKSGGDRTFCAGASFDEMMAVDNLERAKSFFQGFAQVINSMRKCPKLIIGRVQGKAVGGGVGLAAAMDYCMATKYASVKLSELSIGIGPFVIAPAVERKIGVAALSQLSINAKEWKTADWAKQKGLYQEVFDTTEQLDAYIEHLSKQLASYSPEAMQELKQLLWKDTHHWDELLSERAGITAKLALSDFTKAALQKFKKA